MPLHIIIDGYNLIRQSPRLKRLDRQDMQLGRQALLGELTAYKKRKRHRITVVFDGAGAPAESIRKDRINGIDIQFSHKAESADAVIKRMAASEKEKALIVSSDREIAAFAVLQGASVISSLQFVDKLMQTEPLWNEEINYFEDKSRSLSTRKKGPSRRISKRERKNNMKTRKL